MSDPRIGELRFFWCNDAYKNKYNVVYCWSHGKDDKLLKNAIDWCDSSFGHEACVNKMKDGMRAYLRSNDGFVTKDNHPFAMFATSPHKYFIQDKPIEEQVRKASCMFCHNTGLIYKKKQTWRCSCGWGYEFRKNFLEAPMEYFLPVVLDELTVATEVASEPLTYLRGFIKNHEQMKVCCSPMYHKLSKAIKEVCGVKTVLEEFKKAQPIAKRL